MGELAHRRRERDLWISRGHVRAAAVAALALTVGGFAFGYWAGRVPSAPARPAAFTAQIPDDALLEVLARVESSAVPQGGMQALTFPEALKGNPEPAAVVEDLGAAPPIEPPPTPPDPSASLAEVQVPHAEAPTPLVDLPPSGSFTVVAAWSPSPEEATLVRDRLRADGLEAWVAAQLVDGSPQFQVNIGGYATRKAAEAAAPAIAALELEGAVVAFP